MTHAYKLYLLLHRSPITITRKVYRWASPTLHAYVWGLWEAGGLPLWPRGSGSNRHQPAAPPRESGTLTATMSVAWFTNTAEMSSAHMFQGGEHKYQISSAVVVFVTHMIWGNGWRISMPNWIFSYMQYDMFLAAVTAIVFVSSIIMHELYSFSKWWVLCCKVFSSTVHFVITQCNLWQDDYIQHCHDSNRT